MNALTAPLAQSHWMIRRAYWFLFALHLPFVAMAPINVASGIPTATGNLGFALPLALAIGALQLRHSFAAARGTRPPGWQLSFVCLLVVVCAPLIWLSWDWAPMLWFVIASALMLLQRGPALCIVASTLLGLATAQFLSLAPYYPATSAAVIPITVLLVYATTATAVGGIGLFGAARLVCVLRELLATRAELAELAVGRERLRVSRDLHDLLGQSLSAIALKGDVAIRLLRRNPSAARSEIASLAGVAREALQSMRAVTRADRAISLPRELDGATALLRAAGIQAHIDVQLGAVPSAVEEVLAWAVREGVTNVLRHAEARTCSISAVRDGSLVRLEIVNDGVPPLTGGSSGDGSGLASLADRARAQSGRVSAGDAPEGHFKLLVELAVVGA